MFLNLLPDHKLHVGLTHALQFQFNPYALTVWCLLSVIKMFDLIQGIRNLFFIFIVQGIYGTDRTS